MSFDRPKGSTMKIERHHRQQKQVATSPTSGCGGRQHQTFRFAKDGGGQEW